MNVAEFRSALKERISLIGRPVAGALVTYALSKFGPDNYPPFITGRWVFWDEPRVPRTNREYRELKLGEAWISGGNEAMNALVEVLEGHTDLLLHGRGIGGLFTTVTDPEYRIGELYGRRFTEWPEWSFRAMQATQGSQPQVPHLAIAAPGLPPYSTGAEAVSDWVWKDPSADSGSVGYQSQLVIVLPDTRARIERASWVGRQVEVQVTSNVPRGELELQARCKADPRTILPLEIRSPVDENSSWNLAGDPTQVEAYLLHRDGTLLWLANLPRMGEVRASRESSESILERGQRELQSGEDEDVEFKPFVSQGDAKEAELIRTIIAFANGRGGRLYVGVSDQGVPLGEPALLKASYEAKRPDAEVSESEERRADPLRSRGLADGQRRLIDRIKFLVTERVQPRPPIDFKWETVFAAPVLIVTIEPGDDRPYATKPENDVWIRKGSSCHRPDPRTEMRALYTRRGAST